MVWSHVVWFYFGGKEARRVVSVKVERRGVVDGRHRVTVRFFFKIDKGPNSELKSKHIHLTEFGQV